MMGSFFVILESNLFHTQQSFSKTSRATDTEVDAPGDSPKKTEQILELTTSVPN